VLEDDKGRKEVYEFLEDDDDFEEFEHDDNGDVDMELQDDTDKKQW
jgi:hypothetical protein